MRRKQFPKGSVCKPCWELKYCPYGWLVEFFPHYHPGGKQDFDVEERFKEVELELTQKGAFDRESVADYYRILELLDPEANKYASQF